MTIPLAGEKKKVSYFREVQGELKKISWTSKEDLIFCTKAVIFSTFFFGLTIYGVDLMIRGGLEGIGSIFRWIFG